MLLGNPPGKTVLVTWLKRRIWQLLSPSPPEVNTRKYSAPGHNSARTGRSSPQGSGEAQRMEQEVQGIQYIPAQNIRGQDRFGGCGFILKHRDTQCSPFEHETVISSISNCHALFGAEISYVVPFGVGLVFLGNDRDPARQFREFLSCAAESIRCQDMNLKTIREQSSPQTPAPFINLPSQARVPL